MHLLSCDLALACEVRDALLHGSIKGSNGGNPDDIRTIKPLWGKDQELLEKVLWPKIWRGGAAMIHDSYRYLCPKVFLCRLMIIALGVGTRFMG